MFKLRLVYLYNTIGLLSVSLKDLTVKLKVAYWLLVPFLILDIIILTCSLPQIPSEIVCILNKSLLATSFKKGDLALVYPWLKFNVASFTLSPSVALLS